MREIRGLITTVAAVLVLAAFSGCGGAKDSGRAEGVVEAVDVAAKQVTIDHGEIEGLMGAMTMTFDVADPALLAGIEPGSDVRFTVKYADGTYVITELGRK